MSWLSGIVVNIFTGMLKSKDIPGTWSYKCKKTAEANFPGRTDGNSGAAELGLSSPVSLKAALASYRIFRERILTSLSGRGSWAPALSASPCRASDLRTDPPARGVGQEQSHSNEPAGEEDQWFACSAHLTPAKAEITGPVWSLNDTPHCGRVRGCQVMR